MIYHYSYYVPKLFRYVEIYSTHLLVPESTTLTMLIKLEYKTGLSRPQFGQKKHTFKSCKYLKRVGTF